MPVRNKILQKKYKGAVCVCVCACAPRQVPLSVEASKGAGLTAHEAAGITLLALISCSESA